MVRETIFSDDSEDDEDEDEGQREDHSGESPMNGDFDPNSREIDERLRPQKLEDVIGQRKVVERVRVMLDATRKRNDTLGHILFDGPPGIGKTTLATVIPKELGVDFQIAAGPALDAPKDLLPYLTNAGHGSVSLEQRINLYADQYSFAWYNMGVIPPLAKDDF